MGCPLDIVPQDELEWYLLPVSEIHTVRAIGSGVSVGSGVCVGSGVGSAVGSGVGAGVGVGATSTETAISSYLITPSVVGAYSVALPGETASMRKYTFSSAVLTNENAATDGFELINAMLSIGKSSLPYTVR